MPVESPAGFPVSTCVALAAVGAEMAVGVSVTWMLNGLLLPDSSGAAVAVSVNGPYLPADPPSAAAQSGVHVITPVPGLSDAPLGSAGLTDHVSGPAAQLVSEADGVMVSIDSSATVCGVGMAATVTV